MNTYISRRPWRERLFSWPWTPIHAVTIVEDLVTPVEAARARGWRAAADFPLGEPVNRKPPDPELRPDPHKRPNWYIDRKGKEVYVEPTKPKP